jgi:NADPH:quinone reductase-like Zn-dependent oxidoreductase
MQATVVSPANDTLRRENFDLHIENKLNASHFVGEVHKSYEDNLLKEGASVTSLRKCAVQSRFVTMPTESLILIPEKLDEGEAVAVVSIYLPAFGALHHGSKLRDSRFSREALKGQNILVTGGGTDEADAVVKVALLGGASKIFVLNSKNAMASYHVGSAKVVLLSDEPDEWQARLDGRVDLAVDLEYPRNFEAITAAVKEDGRIVCRTPRNYGSWFAAFGQLVQQASLLWVPNASMYDFDGLINIEYGEITVSATADDCALILPKSSSLVSIARPQVPF